MINKDFQQYVVIGDVHGLSQWREITSKHPESAILFLGDYADPYLSYHITDEEALWNLKCIIEFKKSNPNRVELLLGNHDTHYFVLTSPIGSRFAIDLSIEYMEIFSENVKLFDYAFQLDNLLFTHAGVSRGWFEESFRGNMDEEIALQINQRKDEDVLFNCSFLRGGHDTYGGPLWADTDELFNLLPGVIQIVGHNQVPQVTIRCNEGEADTHPGQIIFCDCLSKDSYLLIDASDPKSWTFLEKSVKDWEARNILRLDRESLNV